MAKTTHPRLTKAQKQAQEQQAFELGMAIVEAGSLDSTITIVEPWIDPIKWVDETPTIDQAMAMMPRVKSMKVVKTVKTGVGQQILQHIADGVLSNKEILAKVLEDNPLRKTTYACVAWYQSQVKAGKIDLPEPMIEVMDEAQE